MIDKEKFKIKKTPAGGKGTVLSYVIVPIVFTAVALILFSPASVKADKLVKNYMAVLQEKFSRSSDNLIVFNDDFYSPDYTADGQIRLEKQPEFGDKIASLLCDNAGVNTDVYYGISVQIFGRGAGLNADYSLFGTDKAVLIEGLGSVAFKNLENVSVGDVIKVTTFYGTFAYRVTGKNVETDKADLILSSASAAAPFSDGGKLYICAEKISGPVLSAGEVR